MTVHSYWKREASTSYFLFLIGVEFVSTVISINAQYAHLCHVSVIYLIDVCESIIMSYFHSKMSKEIYENPDLKKERENCPFNKEEITNLLDGGKEKTIERKQLGKIKNYPLIAVSNIIIFFRKLHFV